MKIYKYKIDLTKKYISLPKTFTPLYLKYQKSSFGEGIFLWGELNEDFAEDKKDFPYYAFATGEKIDSLVGMQTNYFGTIETPDGVMLHIYLSNKVFQSNLA